MPMSLLTTLTVWNYYYYYYYCYYYYYYIIINIIIDNMNCVAVTRNYPLVGLLTKLLNKVRYNYIRSPKALLLASTHQIVTDLEMCLIIHLDNF